MGTSEAMKKSRVLGIALIAGGVICFLLTVAWAFEVVKEANAVTNKDLDELIPGGATYAEKKRELIMLSLPFAGIIPFNLLLLGTLLTWLGVRNLRR